MSIVTYTPPAMLRFVDPEFDSFHLSCVKDQSTRQSFSLEECLEPVISRVTQLDQLIQTAKIHCHFPSEHGLTHDQSTAIYLYTMTWDHDGHLYQIIKNDFQSNDQSLSQSWSSYLQLLEDAVQKLPNIRTNIWRGVSEKTSKNLRDNDNFLWKSIVSCSSSSEIIEDYLESNSIMCFIEATNGKDISAYSESANLKEVMLCPGARLRVVSAVQPQTSSRVLHVREVNRQSSPSAVTDRMIKRIPLRWNNDRVLSLLPYFVVLMLALLLGTVVGRSLITFSSSEKMTVLITSLFQAAPVILPLESGTGHASIDDKSSTFRIHVDAFDNRYEGEWKNGKKHGTGRMNFANGAHYTGNWIDDMATGEGMFIWKNGDQYEGQIQNGQRHGKGLYRFTNGDTYTGDWVEDKKEGYGVSTMAGHRYEGQFKDDKMYGIGSFYFANGDVYTGDWTDNKQNGQGIFKWTNGDQYEGGFRAGKMHGNASYKFSNGNIFNGEWADGERVIDHGAIAWASKTPSPMNYSQICRRRIESVCVNIIGELT